MRRMREPSKSKEVNGARVVLMAVQHARTESEKGRQGEEQKRNEPRKWMTGGIFTTEAHGARLTTRTGLHFGKIKWWQHHVES